MAASLASLPSMVIVSGSPLRRMAFFRNRSAASLSRYSVRRKSIVWPCLSTARYRYRHWPVGRIRARYLTARLPNPPVRPVRETFASYGSRERDVSRKFPFRQLHGIHRGQLARSLATFVPFPHPLPQGLRHVRGFPALRLLCPI